MICPRCSANNDNNEQFCYNCGLRLEAPQPSSAGAPTIMISPQQTPPAPTPPAYPPPTYGTPPPTQPNTAPPYNPAAYNPSPYGAAQSTYQAIPTTSAAAVVSLVFGILGWLGFLGIGGIVAVIAGHMARNAIRRSNNTLSGEGMALAGLILGYLNLLAIGLGCIIIFALAVFGNTTGR